QLDALCWQKVQEVLKNPTLVRARVQQLREANMAVFDADSVNTTIAHITSQMENLFELAKHATTDATMSRLGSMMEELEKQRRDAQALLFDIEDDEAERADVERELARFEKWVESVREDLLDPIYSPTYEEKRLAI